MSPNAVFVGASRGIGAALVRRFQKAGWTCVSVARTEVEERQPEDKHRHVLCDVRTQPAIDKLAAELKDETIDLLVYVAAVAHMRENLDTVSFEEFHNNFSVNTFAPLFVTRALLPSLKRAKSPRVIWLTSRGDNTSGGQLIYRPSKAALNMLGKTLSIELAKLETPMPLILLHPAMVKTKSTTGAYYGEKWPMPPGVEEPENAAEMLYTTISKLDMSHTGKFIHRDGYEIPW